MSTPSAFAPLPIVVLLSAASPLPFLALAAASRTPIADARAAGLDRWLPEATGGVWRIEATDEQIDAIERDPACVVWGPVLAVEPRPACRSCGSYEAAPGSDYCDGCDAAVLAGESPATAYAG